MNDYGLGLLAGSPGATIVAGFDGHADREEAQFLEQAIKLVLFRLVQNSHGRLKLRSVASKDCFYHALPRSRELQDLRAPVLRRILRITRPLPSRRSMAAVIEPLANGTLAWISVIVRSMLNRVVASSARRKFLS